MAREPEAIAEQRRGLGERLATFRRAAGLTQVQLADLVAYDRSTLAHIERGQGRADERFWRTADEACHANGDLLAAFHEFEATKAEHQQEARQRLLIEARAKAGLVPWLVRAPALPAGQAQSSLEAVGGPNANLGDLRRAVLGRHFDAESGTPLSARAAYAATVEAHRLYQLADYDRAARSLTALLPQLNSTAVQRSADHAEQYARTTAAAYLAAAKLAAKQADAGLAWVTADRALRLATDSGHAGLMGAARYQVACALQRAGHERDAEQVALDAAEEAAGATGPRPQSNQAAEALSVRGALLLLAAILAARRGDSGNALRQVRAARTLAELLTADGNYLWTAFGPTNVAIHEVAVHIELGDTRRATQIGAGIDTDLLPKVLNGRRSQVHVDLARAAAQEGDDQLAVLHLLEGERVAAQAISRNAGARSLLGELLARERKGATPGLRALATRAEVLR